MGRLKKIGKAIVNAAASKPAAGAANVAQIGGVGLAGTAYVRKERNKQKAYGVSPTVRKAPGSVKKGYPSK